MSKGIYHECASRSREYIFGGSNLWVDSRNPCIIAKPITLLRSNKNRCSIPMFWWIC